MNKATIEKIQNLKNEDLEFYQKLLSFFDFLGIDAKSLENLVNICATFPEFVTKINQVLEDQKKINETYNKFINQTNESGKKDKPKSPFDDLNRENERLNVYGR